MKQKLETFFFHQENSLVRLGIFRIIFSLVLINELRVDFDWFEFSNQFRAEILGIHHWTVPFVPWWRLLLFILAFLLLAGRYQKIVKGLLCVFAIPYFYQFDHHLSEVAPSIWSYTVNLPIFTFLLLLSNTQRFSLDNKSPVIPTRRDSFILAFCQLYVVSMFFQSAISKFMESGSAWFFTHEHIFHHTAMVGTDFGHQLLDHPQLFTIFAMMTGLFEFFGIFLLMTSATLYGAIALCFHLGIFIVMGIPFIFMSPFYIPIFFKLKNMDKKAG